MVVCVRGGGGGNSIVSHIVPIRHGLPLVVLTLTKGHVAEQRKTTGNKSKQTFIHRGWPNVGDVDGRRLGLRLWIVSHVTFVHSQQVKTAQPCDVSMKTTRAKLRYTCASFIEQQQLQFSLFLATNRGA